jgi:transposase
MNTATQITRRRQAIIEYFLKKEVTAAARRYNVSRQYIYRWKNRYDGTEVGSSTNTLLLMNTHHHQRRSLLKNFVTHH